MLVAQLQNVQQRKANVKFCDNGYVLLTKCLATLTFFEEAIKIIVSRKQPRRHESCHYSHTKHYIEYVLFADNHLEDFIDPSHINPINLKDSARKMSEVSSTATKYDDLLGCILQEQKSIIGFLSTIFNFLARRTDFYYISKSPNENLGFPKGVAQELLVRVFQKCHPNNTVMENILNLTDDIMTSTVAQEVEIVAEEDELKCKERVMDIPQSSVANDLDTMTLKRIENNNFKHLPVQINSEAYNGAVRENYSWSQTISEIEVTMDLPSDAKTSKDINVNITATQISLKNATSNKIIIQDDFLHPIKPIDVYWTISSGKLVIHIEKQKEQWWTALLRSEPPIDITKIDCSRPLDELPPSHIAKIQELQWNQQQKMQSLPTSDQLKNLKILEQAWNNKDSPFKGTDFDASTIRFD